MTSCNNHELVVGPTGSGKTMLAEGRLADEHAAGIEVWIIDLFTMLPQWQERAAAYAASITEARLLLAGLLARDPDRGAVTLTVAEPTSVLNDPICRTRIEQTVQTSPSMRLRLVTQTTHPGEFGHSDIIRQAMLTGTVWTCPRPGYGEPIR